MVVLSATHPPRAPGATAPGATGESCADGGCHRGRWAATFGQWEAVWTRRLATTLPESSDKTRGLDPQPNPHDRIRPWSEQRRLAKRPFSDRARASKRPVPIPLARTPVAPACVQSVYRAKILATYQDTGTEIQTVGNSENSAHTLPDSW
jgi:hypothetical protein